MIPNKRKSIKLDYQTTELQRLAQKENFALFQLEGMLGQLVHLNQLKDPIITARVSNLKLNIEGCKDRIKGIQFHRKEMKRISEL